MKLLTPLAAAAMAMAPAMSLANPPAPGSISPPVTTGQPNASCEDFPDSARPGNAINAPGSAFNPDGKAGTVYAGEQTNNQKNTVSVSQYDVACLHAK